MGADGIFADWDGLRAALWVHHSASILTNCVIEAHHSQELVYGCQECAAIEAATGAVVAMQVRPTAHFSQCGKSSMQAENTPSRGICIPWKLLLDRDGFELSMQHLCMLEDGQYPYPTKQLLSCDVGVRIPWVCTSHGSVQLGAGGQPGRVLQRRSPHCGQPHWTPLHTLPYCCARVLPRGGRCVPYHACST